MHTVFAPEKSRRHYVQLYRDDAFLAERAGDFLSEGIAEGEGVLLVAAPAHRTAILARLRHRRIDVARGMARGQILPVDAEEMLGRFTVDGQPQWARFEAAFEPIVVAAASRAGATGLRGYGEMVDLLWQRGEAAAALRVEGFWETLTRRHGFSLLCGYKTDVLSSGLDANTMKPVVDGHSDVLPSGSGPISRAVDEALDDVLGPERAEMLRPLIRASRYASPIMPWAEAAVLWLKNNLPDHAEMVLTRTRRRAAASGR